MPNKIALITGATSGIGEAFAKKLASSGYDLIITGRRENKIRKLAADLTNLYHINCEVMLIELTNKSDLERLIQKVALTKNLDILINNAGYVNISKFVDTSHQAFADLIMVHDYAAVCLMQTALKNMLTNNSGAIINVASTFAFTTRPHAIDYSAAKSYLVALTLATAKEIKDSKVKVQALCPGMTRSDVVERHGIDMEELAKKRGWFYHLMSSEFVAKISLLALEKNKIICVPRFRNKLLVFFALLRTIFTIGVTT